jgi:lactate dehydrogenase-like 2-hydroxyacid dehydrogenase
VDEMSGKSILVTGGQSVRSELLVPLTEAGFEVIRERNDLNEEELINVLKNCVGHLLGGEEYVSRKVIEQCPGLQVVSFLGVNYASYVDVDAANEHDLQMTNTPGTLTDSVAEFVVAQLVAMKRSLYERQIHSVNQQPGDDSNVHQLTGTNVGIIGMGAIGSRVSEILSSAFHCNIFYNSNSHKSEIEKRDNAQFRELSELVKEADSIVLTVPTNNSTHELLTDEILSNIKNPITIVNVSRANVIDADVALKFLKEGKIHAIAYDTFYDIHETNEGAAREVLALGPERVVVTRHIGSLTFEARDAMAAKAVQNLIENIDV